MPKTTTSVRAFDVILKRSSVQFRQFTKVNLAQKTRSLPFCRPINNSCYTLPQNMSSSKRKTEFLGMPRGTAVARLKKLLLFSILKKYNENFVFVAIKKF